MALDFFAHIACPFQKSSRPAAFIEPLKIRAMLEMLDANREEIEQDQGRPLDEITVQFGFEITVEGGAATNNPTVAQMRRFWQLQEEKAGPVCPECPVNWRQRAMGCYAAIRYPISEAGEHWMVDHFDPPMGGQDHLVRQIVSHDITGERFDEERPQEETDTPRMLLASAPVRKRLAAGELELSGSQLLECLLRLQPTLDHRMLFSICTGFRAVDLPDADAAAIAAKLGEDYDNDGYENELENFFSGGVLKILGRGADGSPTGLAFGADEDEGFQVSDEEKEMIPEGGMLSMFEQRGPRIRPPRVNVEWLGERLQEVPCTIEIDPEDDYSIAQFKRFIYTCWVALLAGGIVVIDG